VAQSHDPEVIAGTERLIVRPWRLDEADRFYDMHRRVEVARWIGGRPMRDRGEAVALIQRSRARLVAEVCHTIGLRLLGIAHRWYHEPSLMFWAGAGDAQEPSLSPDGPAPA
jgi:hypothetical protein